MGKLYDPCDFIFNLENVDLQTVSSDLIYLVKSNVIRVAASISVDFGKEIVCVTPNFTLEEFTEYKIVFSSALCFYNGNKFPRSFCIRFRVKGGAAYSPNVIGGVGDSNYYSPQNQLRFSQLLCIHFDDSIDASEDLTFEATKLPGLDDTEPVMRFHPTQIFKTAKHNGASPRRRLANCLTTLIAVIFIICIIMRVIQIIRLDILKLDPINFSGVYYTIKSFISN